MEPSEIIDKQLENRFTKPTWTPELLAALAKAQADFPELIKNQKADTGKYTYRYVDLAELFKLTRPILNKHGIAVSQLVNTTNNGEGRLIVVDTYLFHEGGGYLHNHLELPLAKSDHMNYYQSFGTADTYARRYSYESIIGVASQEDTDAQDIKGNGEKGTEKSGKPGTKSADDDLHKRLEVILNNPVFQEDKTLKKEVEGAKTSMKNIKDKKSLQNFLNLWEKKLAAQPQASPNMTPGEVVEAVQGELVDPVDAGASQAFDDAPIGARRER